MNTRNALLAATFLLLGSTWNTPAWGGKLARPSLAFPANFDPQQRERIMRVLDERPAEFVGGEFINSRTILSDKEPTEFPWGEPVEGVQVRLRAKQTKWKVSAVPRLLVDVRNQGTRRLLVQIKQMHGCQIEVDGQWFQRQSNTRELRARPSPFPPRREYDAIVISLDQYWVLPRNSRNPASLDRMVRLKDKLQPGQHTVRVAVNATADKSEPGKPVRAISNPVELEIVPSPAASAQHPARRP